MGTIREARAYWAHRLHATVLNSIGAAILQSQVCERAVRGALPSSAEEIARLRRMLETLEGETRALTQAAPPRPRPLLEEIGAVVDGIRRQGLPVRVSVRGRVGAVPGRVARGAAVVLTEALANAARHARATVVDVDVTAGEGVLLLRVRDDGTGCDIPRLTRGSLAPPRCGIEIMRAQAAALNGRLEFSSAPGRGTQVSLFAPLSVLRRGGRR